MRRYLRHLYWPSLCLLLLAAAGTCASTVADESELKAAFVYNFTLFTTWPQAVQNLRICVLGETTFIQSLKRYEGRNANGATVAVEHVKNPMDARGCHVLYIDKSEHERIESINKALAGAPVLTVTEAGNLSPQSVHILLVKDGDRFVFDINHAKGTAAGLAFSFKLLKLARNVHEGK